MKKIISLILCLCLLLCFAACGEKTEDKKPLTSSDPTASLPAIGTEIDSEEASDATEPESSEESSSEEEPFDPNGVYETNKDPFMGEPQVTAHTVKVDFEDDAAYVISSGFEKYVADKAKIHGGKASLATRADSFEDPSFFFSIPKMERDAECEITLFVRTEAALSGNLEVSTVGVSSAEALIPLDQFVPKTWTSVTATFFASTADVHLKLPLGAEIYIDDITLTYKQ